MSKIICDICGTSYPETASQCPICGCVRPGDVQRVTNEVKSDGKVSTGYTHVKGGHFSKSNVKKRAGGQAAGAAKNTLAEDAKNADQKNNRGLVITAIVLLLAIIGVVAYIAVRFFGPLSDPNYGNNPTGTTGQAADLSCVAITLDAETITLGPEEARLLQVTLEPKNTSDFISFRSEDETVAVVSAAGKITAVGEGTTTIVVTCGQITKTCTVVCAKPTEPTTPTFEPTIATEETGATEAVEELRLNRSDITFSYKGETWVLYSGNIAKNLITWTSEDESVVTIEDGKAKAVGTSLDGVWVHAEYEGQKASCLIRCSFQESSGVSGSGGGVSEDGGSSGTVLKTGKIVNVSKDANVRTGPGTSYDKNGTIELGKKVTIYETTYAGGMNWAKIGTDMWVSMDYIQVD